MKRALLGLTAGAVFLGLVLGSDSLLTSIGLGDALWPSRDLKLRKSLQRRFDPRGRDEVAFLKREREAAMFRSQLQRGSRAVLWPGLKSAQLSWAWLEMISSIHSDATIEGDFSWFYGKLNFILENSDPREMRYLTGLAPYYFVMGKDHAGATLLGNALTLRAPDYYNTWFWYGWFAMSEIQIPRMAGEMFLVAGSFPGAAPYLNNLGRRLIQGSGAMPDGDGNLELAIFERLRRAKTDESTREEVRKELLEGAGAQ